MSIRNNEDRLGAKPPVDDPIPATQADTGGATFAYVTPTEHVEIPSGGKYYPAGHPLHNESTIEIRYMTAKDEDIMTSPSLIKKGLVLDRLLKSVIVNKNINPDSLLVGDKNAILTETRITGYGSEYSVTVTCPICGSNEKHNFDLEEAKRLESGEVCESVEHVSGDLFSTVLPTTKVTVEFGLLTGADEKKILQLVESKKKKNLPETAFTDQLRMIIRTVNGSPRLEHINDLISNMPIPDGRHLRKVYNTVSPDLHLKTSYTCGACNSEEEVDLPLTAEFFWPR